MKRFAIVLSAFLFLAAVVYVVIESNDINILDTIVPERLANFKNVHLSGIFSSGEVWEVRANTAWTSRSRSVTTLEDVFNASIEKNGRYIIKGLQARRLSISPSKDIEVIKKVEGEPAEKQYMLAYIDFGAVAKPAKKEKKFTLMTADNIKFNPDKRYAVLSGGIRLEKEGMKVRSEKVSIDMDKDVATFESRTDFKNRSASMSSDTAVVFLDTDRITMAGSVEVSQKNKKARSPAASYDDKIKEIEMMGGVKSIIDRPASLLKQSTSTKYKGETAQKTLASRTVMDCDRLEIDTDNNNARAFGRVFVKQKEQEARSERADYSDKDGLIIMTGNVYMKKKEDWIRANKVTVYIDREIFEASGAVETEFKVKKGSR